jgi:DNA polymerase III sliding clamp (beta) subunit (PCNA family)
MAVAVEEAPRGVQLSVSAESLAERIQFVKNGLQSRGSGLYDQALIQGTRFGVILRSFNEIFHSIVRLSDEPAPQEQMLVDLVPLHKALSRVEGIMDMEIDFAQGEIRLRGSASIDHRCAMDGGAFCDIPQGTEGGAQVANTKALADRVRRAAIPIDPAHSQPRLRALYANCEEDSITFCGTTGTVIAELTLGTNEMDFEGEALIPEQAIDQLRFVLDRQSAARVKVMDRYFVASSEDYALVSLLMQEKFPNYRSILLDPEDCDVVKFSRQALKSAVGIASGYTDEWETVYLIISEDEIEVQSAELMEDGKESRGRVSAPVSCESPVVLPIKCAGRLLKAALNPLAGDSVEMLVPVEQEPGMVGFRTNGAEEVYTQLGLMRIIEGEI